MQLQWYRIVGGIGWERVAPEFLAAGWLKSFSQDNIRNFKRKQHYEIKSGHTSNCTSLTLFPARVWFELETEQGLLGVAYLFYCDINGLIFGLYCLHSEDTVIELGADIVGINAVREPDSTREAARPRVSRNLLGFIWRRSQFLT